MDDNSEKTEQSKAGNNQQSEEKLYEYDGKALTVHQWAELLGFSNGEAFRCRLYRGWPKEKVFSPKMKRGKSADRFPPTAFNPTSQIRYKDILEAYNGPDLTCREWGELLGISHGSARSKIGVPQRKRPPKNKTKQTEGESKAIPSRCFVCKEKLSLKEIQTESYVRRGRFKHAHIKCYGEWERVQRDLNMPSRYHGPLAKGSEI